MFFKAISLVKIVEVKAFVVVPEPRFLMWELLKRGRVTATKVQLNYNGSQAKQVLQSPYYIWLFFWGGGGPPPFVNSLNST